MRTFVITSSHNRLIPLGGVRRLDLLDSVEYRVFLAEGAVKDGGEVAHAGITGTEYEFGMTDQTAPTLWTYSPSQGAAGVPIAGNLAFSFSETVQEGNSYHVWYGDESSGEWYYYEGEMVLTPGPTAPAGSLTTTWVHRNFLALNRYELII